MKKFERARAAIFAEFELRPEISRLRTSVSKEEYPKLYLQSTLNKSIRSSISRAGMCLGTFLMSYTFSCCMTDTVKK